MAIRGAKKLTDLVIANGATGTTTPWALADYRNAVAIFISAPATLTGTITIQVKIAGGSTFQTLQDAGADVVLTANKVSRIDFPVCFDSIQVLSSAAEGGARTFTGCFFEEM